MAFTVRVELHGAKENEYSILHDAMARLGFKRTLTGSNGTDYQLPTAEYDYPGDASGDKVRELAGQAASTTGKAHGVLVTEAGGRWWSGLTKQENKRNQYASLY